MKDELKVIVLSQTDYKEADALVKVFSSTFGLQTFVAKGLSKINSKNRLGCLTYNTSLFHFDINEVHSLQVLQTADCLKNRYEITESIEKSSIASLLSELTELLLRNESESDFLEDYFIQLEQILDDIAKTDHHAHLLAYILIQFMNHYGIAPMVDGCVLCGSTKVNSISIEEGGYICQDCQKETQSPILPLDTLKDFRVIGKLSPANLTSYYAYKAPSQTVLKLLVDFLEFHTGHRPKAWEFIEKWSIIK